MNENKSNSFAITSLKDVRTHYCSGCGHGIIHRIVAEIIDELAIREKVIGVAPVGCSVVAYDYWDFDVTEAAHGRAPAVATGIKRSRPDCIVFCYQGDGDLAAIGTAEIIHAASRGENITCIFVNNSIYGMTNGQMAPTTLIGQKTSTSKLGRDPKVHGYPIKITEMISLLDGVIYAERVALLDPANVIKTKNAIKKAFCNQIENKGFSIVEVLSPCPTYLDMTPEQSLTHIKDVVSKAYPLGVLKDK